MFYQDDPDPRMSCRMDTIGRLWPRMLRPHRNSAGRTIRHRLAILSGRRAVGTAIGVLLAVNGMPGQGGKDTFSPPLRLDADLLRFAGTDSVTFVELVYGLSEASLTYRRDSGGYHGAVDMDLEVRNRALTVASRRWTVTRTIPESLAGAPAKNILSIETMTLPPGDYLAVLSCRDRIDSTRRDSVVLPIAAAGREAGLVSLSDIELCSRIAPSTDRGSLFYKNTLEVIPNPSRLFGEGLAVLHFYAEVYNLKAAGTGEVILTASIVDQAGRVLASQSKTKPRANNSSVEYGSMNIASLPGGSYLFRLSVGDSTHDAPRLLANAEKKFFLYHPRPETGRGKGRAAGTADVFAFMTAGEVDDEIRKVAYISSEAERRQAESLSDPAAKRNFLKEFWAGRDPSGTTAGNEAREEYLRRLVRANDRYRGRNREGWLTDRGRISILYGLPDDVGRHPNESETHPYEVWQYHAIQGGVEFVFVDRLGFGEYRLVHSTHRDELRYDNWYDEEAKVR